MPKLDGTISFCCSMLSKFCLELLLLKLSLFLCLSITPPPPLHLENLSGKKDRKWSFYLYNWPIPNSAIHVNRDDELSPQSYLGWLLVFMLLLVDSCQIKNHNPPPPSIPSLFPKTKRGKKRRERGMVSNSLKDWWFEWLDCLILTAGKWSFPRCLLECIWKD